MSQTLSRSKGLALRVPGGWEISQAGVSHLRNLGVSKLSQTAVQVAVDLRAHLASLTNDDIRAFVEEAIKCQEAELFRSAVVMAWLAAIAVLQKEVATNYLAAFNSAATVANPKWKLAVTEDDLGVMKDFDFLQVLQNISVIGKNVREQLQAALKLRNACSHPNSMKIGANAVASYIELLLLNVFQRFQK